MDDETYSRLPDATKNSDAKTAGILTGIDKEKADTEQGKAIITIDHRHKMETDATKLKEHLDRLYAVIKRFSPAKQNDRVLDVTPLSPNHNNHTQLAVNTPETKIC